MKKLEYNFTGEKFDSENIDLFLEKVSVNKVRWHKSLKKYIHTSAKNWLENFRMIRNKVKTGEMTLSDANNILFNGHDGKTSKTCPGILGVLNKSYIVKSPCDILISIKSGKFESTIYSDDSLISNILNHDAEQYHTVENNIFNKMGSCKITFPVVLKTDVPYVFLNPTYHGFSDFYVLPGVIENNYAKYMDLVVHGMFDLSEDKDILIKAGSPIAYMWFPEKTDFVYNPKMKDRRFKTSFNSTVKYQ